VRTFRSEPVTLQGGTVRLRAFRADEFDAVREARARATPVPGAPSADDASSGDRLRERLDASGTLTAAEALFAIEAGGRLVGEIQARRADGFVPPGVYELGIEIYRGPDRSSGFGTEAVALLARWLFESAGAHRFQATTDVDNAPMRRVLERLGFPYEGVLRGFMPTVDGPRDHAMYALTKDDYEDRKDRWTSRS
jgi:RimJ/RimL family protein N-acetyltransferase